MPFCVRELGILLALLIGCSSNSNKSDDSDANNIKSEAESQGPVETVDGIDSKVVITSEDMTIDNSQIVELPSDKLNSAVESILSKNGKGLYTVNADGSIYAIGTASTGIPSNKSGFINSRNIAYAKAEMRAKMEILRLAGEVVTSERNSTLIANSKSGNDPDAKTKATALEKAAAVVDKSLDKALIELGMSDSDVAGMNGSDKQKAYNESFYNYVSSYVASMIKGISVVKIVEGEVGSNDYEISVCVKYSPENQSLASNIKNLGADKRTLNSSTVEKIKALSSEQLISKLGAQFFKDENGNRFVLGFGQSPVRKTISRQSNFVNIARKKARLKAVENIKNLLADDIVGKEISENIEKITEYKNGEESIYTEDNYSELIKSKRSSVKMNTLKIKDWDGVHPVSNTRVIGTIVILTESNNINFKTNSSDNEKPNTSSTKKSEYNESEDIEGSEF
jgi:hypothetical protein